jgi:CheY-like chemotaxis protein
MSVKSQEKGLTLKISISEDIPDTLIGDQFRLKQVIMNLIGNAIKFTEEGEVILNVSLISRSKNSVKINFSVKDTGIGLTKDQQKRLFKPFVQGNPSTTRKFGGTGLGLSICWSIVKLLGGEIGLESEINKGSTFFFTLDFKINKHVYPKMAELDVVECKDIEYINESIEIKKKNILIVEDNEINQFVTNEILSKINVNISIVGNGQEAVTYLSDDKNTIDIILMDLQMPVLDGFGATMKIRKLERHKNTPIIALTADVVPESRSRIFDVGMNDYLLKPFEPETLYEKIYLWAGIKF